MKLRELNTPRANPVDNLLSAGAWSLMEGRSCNSRSHLSGDIVSPSQFRNYAPVMSLTGCPQKNQGNVAFNSLENNHLSEINEFYPQNAVVHHHYCFRLVHLIDS
jgi:hypothetical protein